MTLQSKTQLKNVLGITSLVALGRRELLLSFTNAERMPQYVRLFISTPLITLSTGLGTDYEESLEKHNHLRGAGWIP